VRIRANFFVTLDGKVSDAGGRPVQLLLPAFTGADSYGLPDLLTENDAVVMGRTTFLPALDAPQWPWREPVFVLTSRPLPANTPPEVITASDPGELVERMEAAGVERDVHLIGGPTTMRAFQRIGALGELWLHVVPLIAGEGLPLAQSGDDQVWLELQSSRTFPDGVVELRYTV
jgi:dihydrofolate reductase